MLHETYPVGGDSGETFTHAAQEAGMVTRGAVEVTVNDHVQVLGAGDGYYFDSRQPHRFRNVHNGVSEIVSAVTPPTY
jgi:mannose-6-phosphate isomerase-like protein (cupin superfamily)